MEWSRRRVERRGPEARKDYKAGKREQGTRMRAGEKAS
jgi:hypothetical protein